MVLSEAKGFYRRKDMSGRTVTHPITGNGVSPYVEPDMQITKVKHPKMEDIDRFTNWVREKKEAYDETHSPEAALAKDTEKLERLEYAEYLKEQKEDLAERIRLKKEEALDKSIEDEERLREKRMRVLNRSM